MAVAVDYGGGGASLVDLAVVVHEWGRRIAPVPLVEHAVCGRLLAAQQQAGLTLSGIWSPRRPQAR